MGLTKATYSMIEGAVVNVLDYGADNTGATDSTAAIQAAINAGLNGTVFFPKGAYQISSTININYSNSLGIISANLVGEGTGSVLIWQGAPNTTMFRFESVETLAAINGTQLIENLFFRNGNLNVGVTALTFGNGTSSLGIQAGVGNITIQNCKFLQFNICITTEYESDNITINNNVFETYKAYAIYNVGSACMYIKNNYFQSGEAGSVGAHCEYASISITENLIQSGTANVTGGFLVLKSAGFNITNNYMEFPQPGPAWGVLCLESYGGYIGENTFNAMQGSDVIYIDALSYSINIGPNTYAFYGYPCASLVYSLSTAGNVNVLANQSYVAPVTISNGTPAIVTFTTNSTGMQNGLRVYFTTNGGLPSPLVAYQTYYVVNVSGATFQVSNTLGGPAIATTTAGGGDHVCHILLDNAIKGPGFGTVLIDGYQLLGSGKWTGAPNTGVQMATSGVVAIGNNSQPSGWGFVTFYANGSEIGSITQAGTTGVAYNTTSDYRLKENPQPMQNALETVAKLKPVTYKWKSNGADGQGFIAHELQEVVPDCVTGKKDETRKEQYEIEPAVYEEIIVPAIVNKDGNEVFPAQTKKRLIKDAVIGEREVPVYQGIDTSFLVATLAKAIQELSEKVETLENK